MRSIVLGLLFAFMFSLALAGQSSPASQPANDEAAGIRQAALDYIEGWYEGNPERMERALHPDLAKRIVRVNEKGNGRVDNMGAMSLVQMTRAGYGKHTPLDKQQKDVTILDVYGNAAVAKVVATDWIDYLQLGKVNGRWVIVNVLWELKPKPKS